MPLITSSYVVTVQVETTAGETVLGPHRYGIDVPGALPQDIPALVAGRLGAAVEAALEATLASEVVTPESPAEEAEEPGAEVSTGAPAPEEPLAE